jgi:hypothetical protein
MPWTFSHPAAALPLRRFCPKYLNLAALMIGTLTPDFGYYIGSFRLARYAHTFSGSVSVCLGAGWALLIGFYLVRKPLCYVLPQPHRALLEPLTATPAPLGIRSFALASASLLFGAWSHIVWDAFTHREGWVVTRYPALKATVLRFGDTDVALYHVLQHLSTILGITALLSVFWLWLRRRGAQSLFTFSRDDLWRYATFLIIGIASGSAATLLAFQTTLAGRGYLAPDIFVFFTAVYAAALFVPLLVVVALLCYGVHRRMR